jgi:hypothetical protein
MSNGAGGMTGAAVEIVGGREIVDARSRYITRSCLPTCCDVLLMCVGRRSSPAQSAAVIGVVPSAQIAPKIKDCRWCECRKCVSGQRTHTTR